MNKVVSSTKRPFYFMVHFWGRRYREYFTDLCLPSLLAPNNLPLLRAADGHRLLLATTLSDWNEIERLPIMGKLRQHVLPVLVEIPEDDDNSYTAVLRRQTRCLKRLFDAAYPAAAYGCLLLPDLILSDGLVATVSHYVKKGSRLVLLPALRHIEEGVLDDLMARGLLPRCERLSETGQALNVAPRLLAELALQHLHPDVLPFEEGHPLQPLHPPFRFWRVPNRTGIILHGFFGLPVLMDFSVIPSDHTECLKEEDYESVYLGRNFSRCGGFDVIEDSDECGILSLTPLAVNRSVPKRADRFGSSWIPQLALCANIRQSLGLYARRTRDVIRRDTFLRSMRLHADNLDNVWMHREAQVGRLIERAAGDYFTGNSRFPSWPSINPRYLVIDLMVIPQYVQDIFSRLQMAFRALSSSDMDIAH